MTLFKKSIPEFLFCLTMVFSPVRPRENEVYVSTKILVLFSVISYSQNNCARSCDLNLMADLLKHKPRRVMKE